MNNNFKSGFVAILGRPNVGKSTLVNFLVGQKISIVTPKPQTTRNKIAGIVNLDNAQIILLDTPGLHKGKKELNKVMMEEALSTLSDNDLVIYITDTSENNLEKDKPYIELLKDNNVNAILLINKIDLIKKHEILPMIDKYSQLNIFKEIIPVSLSKGLNCDKILDTILKYLPEGPKFYPDDIISTANERFIVAEIIREKVFLLTKEEVPYSIGVIIDLFKEEKDIIHIAASIIVERDSQKAIIIGKKGQMIKQIGIKAREEIELFLNKKVYLELFVKVIKNWTKDPKKVRDIFQELG